MSRVPLQKPKLIVILGPTASGKSELAVKIAKKFNGEVVSADSRQVYKGLDIGAGKVPCDKNPKSEILNPKQIPNSKFKIQKQSYFYRGIKHHLLDVASPKRIFSVAQYQKLVRKTLKKILKKGKIPILCGGTGFYIQAVVDGIIIPEVPPDWKLRKKLEKKSAKELYKILKKLDPGRARAIEKENPRRLIRAIEIVIKTKKPVPVLKKNPLPYPVLMIGIKKSEQELKKRIKKRVEKMFKMGLEKEVKKLVKKYGWALPFQTIGYQEWKEFFEGKIDKKEVEKLIIQHAIQFAKRQMTWWKSDQRIIWIKNYQTAAKLTRNFLTK